MADFKDVLIWSEVKKDRITTSAKELISKSSSYRV